MSAQRSLPSVQSRIQEFLGLECIAAGHRPAQSSPAESAHAASADSLFANADITYTGIPNADGDYEVVYTGAPAAVGVASVVDRYTGEVYTPTEGDWTDPENDYMVRYFEDFTNEGKFNAGDKRLASAPTEVGNYFVVAINKTAAQSAHMPTTAGEVVSKDFIDGSGYIAQYFKVTNRSLEDAVVVNADFANETYTEGFTYDTTDQADSVGLAIDGKLLDPDTDYDMTITPGTVRNAGEYAVSVTGTGAYAGSTVNLKFEVAPLDLSAATYTAGAVATGGTVSAADSIAVNGDPALTVQALLSARDIDSWSQVRYHGADGMAYDAKDTDNYKPWTNAGPREIGGYEFYAKAVKDNENVTGEIRTTIDVVTTVVPKNAFLYDGEQLDKQYNKDTAPKALNGRTFDLSEGEAYDAAKITVTGYDADEYTVSLATADAAAPGEYTVVVTVDNPGNYSVGGSSFAKFNVVAGIVDTDTVDAVAIIDGVNVPFDNGAKPHVTTYTGEPVVPAITLTCGEKTLVAGEDYTVAYADAQGNAVEEMVNAGTYTVTIESDTYTIKGDNSFTVQIKERGLDVFVVEPAANPAFKPAYDADGNVTNLEDAYGILYTGSEISLELVGTYTTPDNKTFTVELDPSWYLLSGLQYMAPAAEKYSPSEQVLEVGDYKVNVSPTAACANYTWKAENSVEFEVLDAAYFTDVAADAWYAAEVNDAATLGYINGVGDTKLFMPENDINRAELAQVLFNMAGKSVDPNKTYPTPFSDVAADAWFAQPVAWAYSAGVVTGMGDTGTYAPFENATREQVAAMFYRYAKAQGMDVSGSADLSAYADGSAVSGWAAEAVEWAVSEGVFGKGTDVLRPAEPISRAEVAAMAVRLQPEKLTSADVTA